MYTLTMPLLGRQGSDVFAEQLFGSPRGPTHEQIETAKTTKTVRIHPLSMFRKYWDFAVIICVIFSVIVLPFRAAFYWDVWDHGNNHGLLFIQIRVGLFYKILQYRPASPLRGPSKAKCTNISSVHLCHVLHVIII